MNKDDARLILAEWAQEKRARLHDERQNGCPDLSDSGNSWRYTFCPKNMFSMEVEQAQALMTFFDLPELKAVKSAGECSDCLHGYNVSSSTGIWPMIDDCDGCPNPSHPFFIPYTDLYKYRDITREMVFITPAAGFVPAHIAQLREGSKGNYNYYEASDFVFDLESGQRICRLKSLGLLHEPGNKRG